MHSEDVAEAPCFGICDHQSMNFLSIMKVNGEEVNVDDKE